MRGHDLRCTAPAERNDGLSTGLSLRHGDTEVFFSREDERRVIVSLSPAGRRMKEGAHAVPEEILCATQCSLEEVIELTQRLHRLRKSLAQHLEPGLVAARSA